MSATNGWIGVDLDGTLAHYDKWRGIDHIGEPVPAMLERVKAWLAEGKEVRIFTARIFTARIFTARIFTARVSHASGHDFQRIIVPIQEWCLLHVGKLLAVTCQKDMAMIQLWDDRCVQVVPNTGLRVDEQIISPRPPSLEGAIRYATAEVGAMPIRPGESGYEDAAYEVMLLWRRK